jgi:hypothetical protein
MGVGTVCIRLERDDGHDGGAESLCSRHRGGSRASALAPPEQDQEEAVLPVLDEPIGFERHIKAMFRPTDKKSMSFAFDLWSYDDVAQHANAILDRLRAGTMPCDGAWLPPKVDVVQRWIDDGKAP